MKGFIHRPLSILTSLTSCLLGDHFPRLEAGQLLRRRHHKVLHSLGLRIPCSTIMEWHTCLLGEVFLILPISEGGEFRIRQFECVCYCRPPSSPAVRCKPLDSVDVSVEHLPSNLSHLSNCPGNPLAVEAEPCLRLSFLCQLLVGVQPMFCPCPTCGEAGWKAEIEPTPQPPLFSSRAAAVKGALTQTSWLGPGQMPMTRAAHCHKPGRQQGRPPRVSPTLCKRSICSSRNPSIGSATTMACWALS